MKGIRDFAPDGVVNGLFLIADFKITIEVGHADGILVQGRVGELFVFDPRKNRGHGLCARLLTSKGLHRIGACFRLAGSGFQNAGKHLPTPRGRNGKVIVEDGKSIVLLSVHFPFLTA